MINQMNRTQPLGPVNFSEEDLRKLAILLQQMPADEGLASINQQEAELMKSYGGSGTPLPGTQGLGPAGGPVRSYDGGHGGPHPHNGGNTGTTTSTTGSSGGAAGSGITHGDSGGTTTTGTGTTIGPAGSGITYGDSGGTTTTGTGTTIGPAGSGTTTTTGNGTTGDNGGTTGTGPTDYEYEAYGGGETTYEHDYPEYTSEQIQAKADAHNSSSIKFETDPKVIQQYNLDHGTTGAGDVTTPGGDGTTATTTATVTPTKFYDKNGNEYLKEQDALDANVTIDAITTSIENTPLFTDKTFKLWLIENKDTYPIPPSTEAQLSAAFGVAKIKSNDAAAVWLPKMVDSMNLMLKADGSAVPFDTWWATIDPKPANLSEATMRVMYAKAVFKAERKEAFTLTTEELESWMRPPVVIATADNFEEWWEGKKGQFKESGTFADREFAEKAHAAAIIGDAQAVTIGSVGVADTTTIGTIDPADAVTVGTTGDVTTTTVDAISAVTDADMDAIFAGGVDDAEALLVARVEGTAVSPAEVQLKRSVENNLRMLLGATVGADVDPARVRQLRNIWVDMTQEVTGKAAEIRSAESMAAESELVALYQGKSTMKLQVRLANLEVEKQTAFKNADIALASKLANQATRLTEVITQANIDKSLSEADLKSRTDAMIAQGTMDLATALANLQVKKDLAIEQGKADLALSIQNLQKNIILAQTNIDVAVKQRAMDDALAIISYKGEMALMGLEVEIDVGEVQAGLTEMGYELQQSLAELDSATQIKIANIVKQWQNAKADSTEKAALWGSMGTLLTGLAIEWAKPGSDIRMKKNISPGAGEVESFLDALNSYKYEYKDENAPGADAGMFVGVMAQDLEKTPMGASFVQDTPKGKRVDYGHGLAAILASQANIHDRLKHLEEG